MHTIKEIMTEYHLKIVTEKKKKKNNSIWRELCLLGIFIKLDPFRTPIQIVSKSDIHDIVSMLY